MKVQEALDHDWQVGEKLWEVYYKYNSEITTRGGIFRTRQPVGVIEITVTKAERRKAETGWFESINIELNADWGLDEDDNCYINTCIGGMITYRSSGGSYYSNKEFCQDKFFTKKEAEKRYKAAVKTWNKKVERFQAEQKEKLAKAKQKYKKLLSEGIIDTNQHIIKSK